MYALCNIDSLIIQKYYDGIVLQFFCKSFLLLEFEFKTKGKRGRALEHTSRRVPYMFNVNQSLDG